MTNKRKAPSSAGTLARGIEQNTHNKSKTLSLSGQTQNDAKQIADVLFKFQQQFPDFFRDIKPDDPDLDMEKTCETLEKKRCGHER
jgi:hypothetical protein